MLNISTLDTNVNVNGKSNGDGNPPGDPVCVNTVCVNVGGELYTTTLDTLTRCHDSMLGAMFAGRIPTAPRDHHGNYFIDRDGTVFRHVLNFLRSNRLDLPHGFAELPLLRREADFYQIRPLLWEIDRCEARHGALIHAQVDCDTRVLHFNLKRGPESYELCSCSLRVFTADVFCTSHAVLELLLTRFSYSSPDQRDTGVSVACGNSLRVEWAPRPAELPRDQHAKHGYRELVTTTTRPVEDAREPVTTVMAVEDARGFVQQLLVAALAEGFRLDAALPEPADVLNCCTLRLVRY